MGKQGLYSSSEHWALFPVANVGSGDSSVVEDGLVIERSQVRVPAGAVGEFSSPGSSVLILISVFVPPPRYRSST